MTPLWRLNTKRHPPYINLLRSNDALVVRWYFPRCLPGGRIAAAHDNALNCLQSDQQMTTSGSSWRCSRRNRSLMPRSRRKHLSRAPKHRILSKLGYIGCPNVSRWRASSAQGGVTPTKSPHPPPPAARLRCTKLVRWWFFKNTAADPPRRKQAQSSGWHSTDAAGGNSAVRRHQNAPQKDKEDKCRLKTQDIWRQLEAQRQPYICK